MTFYTTKKTVSYRNSAEILAIVEAFEHCTLPLSGWNRKVYLTLAFWYLYLNSITEAGRLMSESLARYSFENGLNRSQIRGAEKAEPQLLLTAMSDFIKPYKSEKSFVALANLVLKHFGEEHQQLKKHVRFRVFFLRAAINPMKVEESR